MVTPITYLHVWFSSILREPIQRIHLAGSEMAELWVGFMDGAVSSGKRVANEILHILGKKVGEVPSLTALHTEVGYFVVWRLCPS